MKSLARLCAVLLFGMICSSLYGCNGQSESKTIAAPSTGSSDATTTKPAGGKKAALEPPGP